MSGRTRKVRAFAKRRWVAVIHTSVFLGMVAAMMFAIPHAGAAFKYLKTGMEIPDVMVEAEDGESISLLNWKGEPVSILIFWATWSNRCKPALLEVQKLFDEFGGKGLKVLAVNVNSPDMKLKDRKEVSRAKADWGLTLPMALDQGYQAYNTFGVVATPSFALVDESGKIVHEAASFRKATGVEIREQVEILLGLREAVAIEEKPLDTSHKPLRKALLHYNLGRNLLAQGNREKAIRKLEAAVEADEKFAAPRVLLGHLLLEEDSSEVMERVETLFREVLETEPENVSALSGLGEVLLELGRIEEAAEAATKAISLNDAFTPAICTMACVLAKQGKAEDARARFEDALALNPLDPKTFYRRGESWEDIGDLDAAAADYRKAVEILMGVL